MKSIFKTTADVVNQRKLTDDIYDIILKQDEIAGKSKPGQFVSIYCKGESRLLPRPISICEINKIAGTIRLVYRVVGEGTREFSEYEKGQKVDIMGPLGNGFTITGKKPILMGGGIGIPPMLELAKQFGQEVDIVLGYRDNLFLNQEFESYGNVYIASEDGSVGVKGNVLDAINEYKLDGDVIYACGPLPMLKAITKYAKSKDIEAQISMEERMACGIGACLACVCDSKEVDHHTNVYNKRVCKDGPVFLASEVVFE